MMIKSFKMIVVLLLISPLNLLAYDWQTFGLYRASYHGFRESLFNPNGFTVKRLGFPKVDYYCSQYLGLDGNFASLDWQLDVMGIANYGKKWEHELRVKQIYVRKDLSQNWDVMIGRSILRWGTGYAFNPTDVVAAQKELSDPDNVEKRVPGNDLIKLEYFGESFSIALVYLANLKYDDRLLLTNSRIALRWYMNFWGLDLSVISRIHQHERPIIGGNFSYVIGDRLEIHGEISLQKGSYQNYHRALLDSNMLYASSPLLQLKARENRLFNRILLGFNYTLPKNINWMVEYYHQDQGYSREEWNRVIDYVGFLNKNLELPDNVASAGNLLWSLNVFAGTGAMQDYLMNYFNIPLSSIASIKATTLHNLMDHSTVIIPEFGINLKNHFTFYARSFIFSHKRGTEYGELFQSFSVEGGIRCSF